MAQNIFPIYEELLGNAFLYRKRHDKIQSRNFKRIDEIREEGAGNLD